MKLFHVIFFDIIRIFRGDVGIWILFDDFVVFLVRKLFLQGFNSFDIVL
jgi:hypothetical protein